jgi:hypothetical protein
VAAGGIVSAVAFTFDEATHVYHVEGSYCLATSDVISLAGLSNYDGVPLGNIEGARWRGKEGHKAIHYYEENDLDIEDVPEQVMPSFTRYLEWKDESGFIPIPPFEHSIVYEHEEMFIGCHIDLRGYIPGKGLYVLDPKFTYPNSGQAKKQTHLRWRMQLQSYWEASQVDDQFWESAVFYDPEGQLHKAILHLHPKATQTFIEFPMDDSAAWDACVQLASMKIANGFKVTKS